MMNKTLSQHIPALFVAVAGLLLVLTLTLFAPASAQFLFIGTLLSVVVAVAIPAYIRQMQQLQIQQPDVIHTALRLASDPDFSANYWEIGKSLVASSRHNDPIYRQETLKRIERLNKELKPISEGNVIYEDGERWRLAYEKLLRSPGLHTYRSVAIVNSPAYWQNDAARQSMKLNFELQAGGTLSIERIVVIDDLLWPANQDLPDEQILTWIDDQHRHGIWLRLARLSVLVEEPDLAVDVGIYGNRAVGTEEIDQRTKRPVFCLSFDFDDVRKAEDSWDRLSIYSTSYRELLEKFHPGMLE